jgi:hypothetical protein
MGPKTAQVGVCAVRLSSVERARGRREQARALAERALELLEADGTPQELAQARLALGQALEDGTRARGLVEQAVAGLSGRQKAAAQAWLRDHRTVAEPITTMPVAVPSP